MCLQIIYIIKSKNIDIRHNKFMLRAYIYIYICMYVCMYKEDLELNNLQWFICVKTQRNQIIYIQYIKRIRH